MNSAWRAARRYSLSGVRLEIERLCAGHRHYGNREQYRGPHASLLEFLLQPLQFFEGFG